MAHEIDFSTGEPAMAYVGERPWHGHGARLNVGESIDVWLQAARLDWDLKRLPVQFLVPGGLKAMDDRFVLVRSDNEQALSIVSADYEVMQPREVIEFYQDLVTGYGYSLETAGALNGGRKVWALARTGMEASVGGDGLDGIAAYLLLATSCDKTLATTVAFTSERVMCKNTLFFALDDVRSQRRQHMKVPHTHRFNSAQVKDELGLMDQAWARFVKQAQKMAECPLDAETASQFFEGLLLQGESPQLSNRAQREHATLSALFESAPGQDLASARETLWGGVNAVTYYVDHARSGVEPLDSAWFGRGAALKEKAWATALDLIS